jgi:hypothetical protein
MVVVWWLLLWQQRQLVNAGGRELSQEFVCEFATGLDREVQIDNRGQLE